jgi:hypothetical protein
VYLADQARKGDGINVGIDNPINLITGNKSLLSTNWSGTSYNLAIRDNQYTKTGAPASPNMEDRTVRYRDGTTTTQMAMKDTGMTWSDTQQYISYLPADGPIVDGEVVRVPRADYVTGAVDMQGYLDWLNKNGYNINMTAQ